MNLSRTILLFFSLLVMGAAWGQDILFSTRHDHLGLGFHDAATYVDVTIGGYPIVFAMCDEPSYFNNRVCVSILSETGDYLSTTSFGDTTMRFLPNYDGTVKLANGNFAGAIEGYPNDSTSMAMLWLFDAWGDTLWTRTPYPDPGTSSLAITTIEASDGDVLVTGHVEHPGQLSKVFLIRYDLLGTEIWRKEFNGGGPGSKRVMSADALSDGGFILGACRISWDYSDVDGWIIRTNTSGNVVWDTIVNTPYDDGGRGVMTYDADRICIAGMPLVPYGNYPPEDCCRRPYVAMLDTSGSVLWEHIFPLTGAGMDLTTVQRGPDGGLLFAGMTYHQAYNNAFLFKVDEYGDSLWYHEYYLPDSSCINHSYYPFSMVIESSGDVILAGQAGFCGEDQWVMRVDEEGMPPPTMQLWTGMVNNVPMRAELLIVPNPSSGSISIMSEIRAIRVGVLDLQGRRLRDMSFGNGSTNIEVDLAGLAVGAYVIEIIDGTGKTLRRTVIKE